MTTLITGCTGQTGSYLAELCLRRGDDVYGLIRRSATPNHWRIRHLLDHPRFHLICGDLTDTPSLFNAVEQCQPDEIYNLAAQSFVRESFTNPETTLDITGMGCLRLLEVVRKIRPDARFYQASSSEMFGAADMSPQNETTPFRPRSPYGVAKVMAHHTVTNYREAYGMFAVSGILFNHESPRRGAEFLTRKVTKAAARIKLGLQDTLRLGALDACRDWGHAEDYVVAMTRMLERDIPEDLVIGTGETHSVEEFVAAAFAEVGLDWRDHVIANNDAHLRPSEIPTLRADATRAKISLRWKPTRTFRGLIREMVSADLASEKGKTA